MALEQEFYRAMAHRVRELAGRADPFIKGRLLALAERYEAKDGEPSVSRSAGRPLPPLRLVSPAAALPGPGEARGTSPLLVLGGLSAPFVFISQRIEALGGLRIVDRSRQAPAPQSGLLVFHRHPTRYWRSGCSWLMDAHRNA